MYIHIYIYMGVCINYEPQSVTTKKGPKKQPKKAILRLLHHKPFYMTIVYAHTHIDKNHNKG